MYNLYVYMQMTNKKTEKRKLRKLTKTKPRKALSLQEKRNTRRDSRGSQRVL